MNGLVTIVDNTPDDYEGQVQFLAAGIRDASTFVPLGIFDDIDDAEAAVVNSQLDRVWVDILPLNVAL